MNFGILYYKNVEQPSIQKPSIQKPNIEQTNISKVIVVSRYNENLEWLKDEPFNEYPVIIYNKGPNDNFYKPEKLIKIVNLENIGRCDHTYLYHIIQEYDNLHDITIFLPGSTNINYKLYKSKHLLFYIKQQNKAVFLCNPVDINSLTNFQLDNWQSTATENYVINPENKLTPSSIRPFGKWFNAMFGDTKINYIAWNSMFSVSKIDVLQHSRAYY